MNRENFSEQQLSYEDNTPTPPGWRRKIIVYASKSLIPRTDVVFVAPNGEEFRKKSRLQRYLKANKGSPPLSKFIWSIDEAPRRSLRSESKCFSSLPMTTNTQRSAADISAKKTKSSKDHYSGCDEASIKVKDSHNRKIRKLDTKEFEEDDSTEFSGFEQKEIDNAVVGAVEDRKLKEDSDKEGSSKEEQISNQGSSELTESINSPQTSEEQYEDGEEGNQELNGIKETEDENGANEMMEKLIPTEGKTAETLEMRRKKREDEKTGSKKDSENEVMKDAENDEGTTTSLLGSDSSIDGREINSHVSGSEEEQASQEDDVETSHEEPADDSEGS
ncbi:hypothetical protein KP509_35G018500 [Ceratopteris richardii]|uniref:MBD domain-containing protein n=1 Tax=Ceratopteris richardii TaxID=49495 RepID=A0A8T2QGC9_CERRI|nr:hypothetical protein KP509_35G018500 [Ceratopteris richardii]